MHNKSVSMRARPKSGNEKKGRRVRRVSYELPDKGEGVSSTVDFHPSGDGPNATYHPSETEFHANPKKALGHFKQAMGLGSPAPAPQPGAGSPSDLANTTTAQPGAAAGAANEDE